MLNSIIKYFTQRHLLANFILLIVLVGGVYFWNATSKEELPNITFDVMRISVSYPGAAPGEVEYFVTIPIEDAVKNLDGVREVSSAVSTGFSSTRVELDTRHGNRAEIINNIKSIVYSVRLPDEVKDEPSFREYKSAQKAVLDILIYDESQPLLSPDHRQSLQRVVLALENQLLNLREVQSINRSGFLSEQLQILIAPEILQKYRISYNQIASEIRQNNIRIPAGSLSDPAESKVTLTGELDSVEKLKSLVIQGGFSGKLLRLGEIATIRSSFEDSKYIMKANGFEAIQLNIVKSSDAGIITAVDAVKKEVAKFQNNQLKGSTIKAMILDDESKSVRDRISLIVQNGLIGFVLILLTLFIFLDLKSGFWVALGIPFTMCFTLIAGSLSGLTINNITLAAVIVVMGMVVDDAIVVAENVSRLKTQGLSSIKASIQGTVEMFRPIVASVLTTCIAFLPLVMFSGRMSRLIVSMPMIIAFMLGASLFESTLILPGHLHLKWFGSDQKKKKTARGYHWFFKVEDGYGRMLERVLRKRLWVFAFFVGLLLFSGLLFKSQFKFVMFPSEETTEVVLSAVVSGDKTRHETALKAGEVEAIFAKHLGQEVVGYRTYIARGMRGRGTGENQFRMRIELVPREERAMSSRVLMKQWVKEFKSLQGFDQIQFTQHRFGSSSGSPIEVVILENDEATRARLAETIKAKLESMSGLKNVAIDSPQRTPEYRLQLKRDEIRRLGVSPTAVGSTLRAIVEGTTLYTLLFDQTEVDVKLGVDSALQENPRRLFALPVETQQGYLIPLSQVVQLKKDMIPSSIEREKQKRVTKVFADFKVSADITPLQVAEQLESEFLPGIMSENPSSYIYLGGEVKDSRESTGDFIFGLSMVLFLIYLILALLFNSLGLPFVIMLSIPFGVIGVILAFWAHGLHSFGFFTFIGVLGLSGVVVNDSIVMVSRLLEAQRQKKRLLDHAEIVKVAQTRLRAVVLTTVTTVAGLFPTAYGIAGYDSMLAEMMLAMGWGLIFATVITLALVPVLFSLVNSVKRRVKSLLKNS